MFGGPSRTAKFQVFQNKSNDSWRWRLVAANGEELANSQPYSSKQAAMDGTEALKRAANDAELVELDEPLEHDSRSN